MGDITQGEATGDPGLIKRKGGNKLFTALSDLAEIVEKTGNENGR